MERISFPLERIFDQGALQIMSASAANLESMGPGTAAEEVLDAFHRPRGSEADSAYLAQEELVINEEVLMDEHGYAVMMKWEQPLMKSHADFICGREGSQGSPSHCGAMLNIGFGMGLVDDAIQSHSPALHVICEAHPQVLARAEAWAKVLPSCRPRPPLVRLSASDSEIPSHLKEKTQLLDPCALPTPLSFGPRLPTRLRGVDPKQGRDSDLDVSRGRATCASRPDAGRTCSWPRSPPTPDPTATPTRLELGARCFVLRSHRLSILPHNRRDKGIDNLRTDFREY